MAIEEYENIVVRCAADPARDFRFAAFEYARAPTGATVELISVNVGAAPTQNTGT